MTMHLPMQVEVVLWEACDPYAFSGIEGVQVLVNEANIRFILHSVVNTGALFKILAGYKVMRIETQRIPS
jgi:hypothetical protein